MKRLSLLKEIKIKSISLNFSYCLVLKFDSVLLCKYCLRSSGLNFLLKFYFVIKCIFLCREVAKDEYSVKTHSNVQYFYKRKLTLQNC